MPVALVGTAALLAAASSASFWALSMTIFPGFDLNAFLISSGQKHTDGSESEKREGALEATLETAFQNACWLVQNWHPYLTASLSAPPFLISARFP